MANMCSIWSLPAQSEGDNSYVPHNRQCRQMSYSRLPNLAEPVGQQLLRQTLLLRPGPELSRTQLGQLSSVQLLRCSFQRSLVQNVRSAHQHSLT